MSPEYIIKLYRYSEDGRELVDAFIVGRGGMSSPVNIPDAEQESYEIYVEELS